MKTFWRREEFNPDENYSTLPKWHRFEKIVQAKQGGGHYIVVAKCGYRFTFGPLSVGPRERNAVATKKLRCAKCDAAHEKETP